MSAVLFIYRCFVWFYSDFSSISLISASSGVPKISLKAFFWQTITLKASSHRSSSETKSQNSCRLLTIASQRSGWSSKLWRVLSRSVNALKSYLSSFNYEKYWNKFVKILPWIHLTYNTDFLHWACENTFRASRYRNAVICNRLNVFICNIFLLFALL